MASRGMQRREIMDILNESDETDQEYLAIPLSATIPFEDLYNEVEIERYYRRISSIKISGSNPGMQSRRHKKSKHVQTDPDIANIPASWLLEGQNLIEELYTGLGNIINVVYHNSESRTAANVRKECIIDPKGMKYFNYDNGHWQSTLLPNIKIPDRMEIDSLNRPFFSEDLKRKLHGLLDVAAKLRNLVPYVTNLEPQQSPQTVEDKAQFYSNEKLSRDFKGNRLPSLFDDCPSDSADRHMDLSNDSFETLSDSLESSQRSPGYCDIKKNETKRVRKGNSLKSVSERNAVRKDSRGFEQIPGVQVSKCTLKQRARSLECARNSEPGVSKSLKSREIGANAVNSERSGGLCIVAMSVRGIAKANNNVTASCSNDFNKSNKVLSDSKATQRREKHLFCGQENHPKNKPPPHSGSQINFIRRNIMATKSKVNHVGSSAGSNEHCNNSESRKASQNVIPRGVSQNRRENIRSSLR